MCTRICTTSRALHSMRVASMFAMLAIAPLAAHADTVASLLGNFTINQYAGLELGERALDVHYAVVFGQLPALSELHAADADGDGVTTQEERDAHAGRLAPMLAGELDLTVDGTRVPLRVVRWTTSLPTEQGGFSLRIDADFSATPAMPVAAGGHEVTFANRNYDGRFGWREIAVVPRTPMSVYATNAFSTSLTQGLTEAVREMPAAGPLAERTVRFTFTRGTPPVGATPIAPRAPSGPSSATAAPSTAQPSDAPWLARATRRLVDSISSREVSTRVLILALLGAFVLGALHALSPGHGKSVVGAYLI